MARSRIDRRWEASNGGCPAGRGVVTRPVSLPALRGHDRRNAPRPSKGWQLGCDRHSTEGLISEPHVRTSRRHRRIGHARRRCQSQGAEGHGRERHRLRCGRARLPDARQHRRGRGCGMPRPEEPQVHAGRRSARAPRGDRREDRCATRASSARPARCSSPTAASTPCSPAFAALCDPGRRGDLSGAVLDDVSRSHHARRRRAGDRADRRDHWVQGDRRTARCRADPAHQGAAVRAARTTRAAPSTRRRRSKPSGDGRSTTASGS